MAESNNGFPADISGLGKPLQACLGVFFQLAVCIAYVVCSFVLPPWVSFLSEAAHFATFHAIVWFAVAAAYLAIKASLPSPRSPICRIFPVSVPLSESIIALSTIVNAALLIVVGVESWLRTQIDEQFTILGIVQAIAAFECGCAVLVGLVLTARVITYLKAAGTGELEGGEEGLSVSLLRTDRMLASPCKGGGARAGTTGKEAGRDAGHSGLMDDLPVPFLSGPAVATLQGRVRAAEAAEAAALAKCTAMAGKLAWALKAGGGAGQGQAPQEGGTGEEESPSSLASTLARTMEEYSALVSQHRVLQREREGLADKVGKLDSELKRAAADVQRFRAMTKDLTKERDRLTATLHLEREANALSQATIADLRARALANGLPRGQSFSASAAGARGQPVTAASSPLANPALAERARAGAATGFTSPGGLARQASRSAMLAKERAQVAAAAGSSSAASDIMSPVGKGLSASLPRAGFMSPSKRAGLALGFNEEAEGQEAGGGGLPSSMASPPPPAYRPEGLPSSAVSGVRTVSRTTGSGPMPALPDTPAGHESVVSATGTTPAVAGLAAHASFYTPAASSTHKRPSIELEDGSGALPTLPDSPLTHGPGAMATPGTVLSQAFTTPATPLTVTQQQEMWTPMPADVTEQ